MRRGNGGRSGLLTSLTVAMMVLFGTTCSSGDAPRHAIPRPGTHLAKASLPWTQEKPTPAPRAETRAEHANPWLRPHAYDSTPIMTFTHVMRQIQEREGWSVTFEGWDEDAGRFQVKAEVIRPLYPYWDEVRIDVLPYGDGDSEVRMLSRTIERRWDLGANRRRVIAFMAELDSKMEPSETDELKIEWPEPKPRKDSLAVGVIGPQPLLP